MSPGPELSLTIPLLWSPERAGVSAADGATRSPRGSSATERPEVLGSAAAEALEGTQMLTQLNCVRKWEEEEAAGGGGGNSSLLSKHANAHSRKSDRAHIAAVKLVWYFRGNVFVDGSTIFPHGQLCIFTPPQAGCVFSPSVCLIIWQFAEICQKHYISIMFEIAHLAHWITCLCWARIILTQILFRVQIKEIFFPDHLRMLYCT